MKNLCLTSAIAVFLMFCFIGLQAQNVTSKLDQFKLAQVFLGTWQQNVGKDTLQVSENRQYGNLIIENVYLVIKGKKSLYYTMNFGFSSKEDKFKGIVFYTNGFYQTWEAAFTSEKIFSGNFIRNFNPEVITGKFEAVLENPVSMTMAYFNTSGVKTGEYKVKKIK